MGLADGLTRRWASAAAIVLLIIWLWVAFERPNSLSSHIPWHADGTSTSTSKSAAVELEIHNAFDASPIESQPIKNMCSGTQWNNSLLFTCTHAAGNAAQVRTSILTCVRYAMMAGADIILPQIINPFGRHQFGPTLLDLVRQDFDFMFDTDHFLASMRHSCPEMHVYLERDHVPFPDNDVRPPVVTIYAEHMVLREDKDWRTTLYELVDELISPTEDTLPIQIEMANPHPTYNIYSDGLPFASDFGQLLLFRPSIRDLASRALTKLAKTYSLPTLNETSPATPHPNTTFLGVHLSTDQDALPGWPSLDPEFATYDAASANILSLAAAHNHTRIYVAASLQMHTIQFAKDAAAKGISVHTKFELLDDEDRQMMWRLAPDQRDMVDLLVLLKASEFVGIGHASLAWQVALRRHLFVEGEACLVGEERFEDRLSRLLGRDGEGEKALFHHMWP